MDINATYSVLQIYQRSSLSPLAGVPKDHSGRAGGQVHSAWNPQRGSKQKGPCISWHLLGLKSFKKDPSYILSILELTRELIFANTRVKSLGLPKQFCFAVFFLSNLFFALLFLSSR